MLRARRGPKETLGNVEINHDRTWTPGNLCGYTRRFSRTANTVSEEPYYGMQLSVDWAAAPAVFTAGVCLPLPQLELSRNSLSHAGEGLITNRQTWSDGSGNRRQMRLGDGIGSFGVGSDAV